MIEIWPFAPEMGRFFDHEKNPDCPLTPFTGGH
jgi:hypothetical protein